MSSDSTPGFNGIAGFIGLLILGGVVSAFVTGDWLGLFVIGAVIIVGLWSVQAING